MALIEQSSRYIIHFYYAVITGRYGLVIRRTDRIDADGIDGVRCGRRRVHDPSERPGDHGDAHLPALALVPADRRAGRRRTQGIRALSPYSYQIAKAAFSLD